MFQVRMPRGHTIGELEAKAENVAATLRIREVRIQRDPDDAGRATVTLIRGGARRPQRKGSKRKLPQRILELLTDTPVRQSALARQLDVRAGDDAFRKALQALERDGQAVKTSEGWARRNGHEK